jgi:glutamate transport system permease protein
LLFFTVLVLPQLGPKGSFYTLCTASLSIYYGAFVCEVVRSGIEAVPSGQVEAARSVGLRHSQVVRIVVVPQSIRSMVPPLIGLFIQLVRSSAVAGAFGVFELFAAMRNLTQQYPNAVWAILAITAVFYLVITIPSGMALGKLEQRSRLAR